MANTIERVLGWIAFGALVLAAAALVINYVPGVRPWIDQVVASIPNATPTPSIGDAQDALDRGDAVGAAKLAAAVVAANAKDPTVDNHAGNIALSAGDEKTAERDYLLGEAADPKNAWNFVALGELYARQGKYDQADTQLRAALTIVPNAQFLHYDLGVVELGEHLPQSALADFEAELRRTPGYAPALQGRVEALTALGRTLDARAARMIAQAKLPASPSPRPSASASPSPSPSPSPALSPSPATSPSSTPTPTATPSLRPSPRPTPVKLRIAKVTLPSPTPTPSPSLSPTPFAPLPRSIADLASDAKGYLFDVASDPGFTRALPFADPTESVSAIRSAILNGSIEEILSSGTAGMLSHHFALAQSAFAAATEKAPSDWRGPYLAGINAQQRGDQAAARTFFTQATSRGGPAAAYVSLAIADAAEGADSDALDSAQHAVSLAPTFMPALFTAGMVDLLMADVPSAQRDLSAAIATGAAPERTTYFLTTLRAREGLSP